MRVCLLVCVYLSLGICAKDGKDGLLIVTPYLEVGDVEEAQRLSLTTIGGLKSYSGYFTVDQECRSNLFFWFFPAKQGPSDVTLLWLNGGPGSSSMFGLFHENGPWSFSNRTGIRRRKFAWTEEYNVIYLDQPVGTGFSYTTRGCYLDNMTDMARQVVKALTQFYLMFPDHRSDKLFLTGESYAGHYLPAIAVEVDKHNKKNEHNINLIGLIIGNPFLDITCVNPLDFAYDLGIIDRKARDAGNADFNEYVKAIANHKWKKAAELDVYTQSIYFSELADWYNVLRDKEVDEDFAQFLNHKEIQRRLHVGSIKFYPSNDKVFHLMWSADAFISILPSLEYLLDSGRYIVGFYAGQLDLVCPYTSLTCALERLRWSGASSYRQADRRPWYVQGRLAGWVKVSGNLFEVAVRAAGHFVPKDQGQAALELISAAVKDVPGSPLLTTRRVYDRSRGGYHTTS